MPERTYEFHWDIIGDLHEGRPNLGDQVNIVLYRLMQYTFHEVIVETFGDKGANQVFREAGNIAGKFFFKHFLEKHKDLPLGEFIATLHVVLNENGLRFVRIDSVDADRTEFTISIATGIDGANLEAINVKDIGYDLGFTEGILSTYAGKEYKAAAINTNTAPEIFSKIGDPINLIPYRMLQYTVRDVTEQRIGTEPCDQLFYAAGVVAGNVFFDNFMVEFKELPLSGFVGELQRILKDLGVGVLRVEKADPDKGEFTLTVSEDLDCSGLPDLGIEVCNYDEGFVAAIFCKYTGLTFKAKEVDCWCSGDRTCRFTVSRA